MSPCAYVLYMRLLLLLWLHNAAIQLTFVTGPRNPLMRTWWLIIRRHIFFDGGVYGVCSLPKCM